MKVNTATIKELIVAFRDDSDMLELLEDALRSFQEYHAVIYTLELKKQLYSGGGLEANDYRVMVTELDRARTSHHNAVLVQVNVLNRMAKSQGLPPFYDGIVSEERPYRREVANAVLEYVQTIIESRG